MQPQPKKERVVTSSGLFVSATGDAARCQNPMFGCCGHAVMYHQKSGLWLCQSCSDLLYDVEWGLG